MSNVRVRRSAEEIVKAREDELAKARNRAALEGQMTNPIVQKITKSVDEYSKIYADSKKGFNGNKNAQFQTRIDSHNMWIKEIELEREYANARIRLAEFMKPRFQALRNEVAGMLVAGSSESDCNSHTTEQTDLILSDASSLFEEVEEARIDYERASEARSTFIAGKKATKATTTQEASAQA